MLTVPGRAPANAWLGCVLKRWRARPLRPVSGSGLTDLACLLLLAAVSVILGLLWCFSVPFDGGPDEAAHFHVARFIRDHGRLPLFAPDEMWLYRTTVGVVESYAAFPPLAYAIAALALPLFDGTFWGGRAISLASYVGTVLMTFVVGRRLLPHDRGVAISAALVVGLLPQVPFTGSYFNNDALALLEVSILLYLLLVLREQPGVRVSMVTGLLIGALLLTKYTSYAVAGVLLIAGVWACIGRAGFVWRGVYLVLVCAAVSGWWFARNWALYGEPIPSRVIQAAKDAAGGNSLFVAKDHGINLLTLSFVTDFWPLTLTSFVGTFGFQTIFLDTGYYLACLGLAVLALVGVVRRLSSGRVSKQLWSAAAVGGAMILATAVSAMAISTYGEWSPQGRYLFPALIPLSLGLAVGWKWVAPRGRGQGWLRWAPIAGLAALNGVSLLGWVVPGYFGPVPRHILLQVDRAESPLRSDEQLTVAGWSVLEAATGWQPFSPDVVAGYRRPVSDVRVYADGPPGEGTPLGPARYGTRRSDVADRYGSVRRLSAVGYEFVAPAGSLEPGDHRLYICGFAGAEAPVRCSDRRVSVL